jgi:hypothetical protein
VTIRAAFATFARNRRRVAVEENFLTSAGIFGVRKQFIFTGRRPPVAPRLLSNKASMNSQHKGGKWMKKELRTVALGAALAFALAWAAQPALAKQRGNSGLPPGPGNPIAAVQAEVVGLQDDIKDLQKSVSDLDKRIDDIEALLNAPATVWINYLGFLSGDTTVLTATYRSTNSGVGSGLGGLVIQSSTVGAVDSLGGDKFISTGLQVPPNFSIAGVRVCYEWSAGATSHITQIRLAQLQNPPSTAVVKLDDATVQPSLAPVCVDSTTLTTPVDASLGAVTLDLRINTGNIADKLVLRGVALHLVPTP